jgi:hypothetical protein
MEEEKKGEQVSGAVRRCEVILCPFALLDFDRMNRRRLTPRVASLMVERVIVGIAPGRASLAVASMVVVCYEYEYDMYE